MTCKDCIHECYTTDVESAEKACNFFVDKRKYVKIVRCKDCAMYEENKEAHTTLCRRELSYLYATPSGGCTYGKRKDGAK